MQRCRDIQFKFFFFIHTLTYPEGRKVRQNWDYPLYVASCEEWVAERGSVVTGPYQYLECLSSCRCFQAQHVPALLWY